MKLDFLKTVQQLGPCGLRPIIEVLNDTYPIMAFSDWKNLAITLIDEGYATKKGNGQYMITPIGNEVIKKGQAFFDDDNDNEENHWKESSISPMAESQTKSPQKRAKSPEEKSESSMLANESSAVIQIKQKAKANSDIPTKASDQKCIRLPIKDSSAELKKMTIDDLLIVFTLGKEAETIIETRLSAFNFARKVASNE